MPRENNANPMNPRKRGKWKPKGHLDIQQLPQALVMDILSRLSIKTLRNCRKACKEWLHMISDPQFAHLHRLKSPINILIKTMPPIRAQSQLGLFHVEKSAGSGMQIERMKFVPQNSLPCSLSVLINTCHGFVCLSEFRRDGSLYVCNPILGQYISIPSPDKSRIYPGSFTGIGFSAKTKEYKVIQTSLREYKCNELEANIYTIGTGVWRSLGNLHSSRGDVAEIPFNSFLHGVLHWVLLNVEGNHFIQSFDFEREEFKPLLPPASLKEFKSYDGMRLGVLKSCLFLCVFSGNDRKSDMWIMKDYGVQESWTKLLVIENLYPRYSLVDNHYEPIMFLSDAEILMTHKRRSVVHYNQETKCLQRTGIVQTRSRFQALGYSPCFVSLNGVSNGEEVKRIRDNNKIDSLLGEGMSETVKVLVAFHRITSRGSSSCLLFKTLFSVLHPLIKLLLQSLNKVKTLKQITQSCFSSEKKGLDGSLHGVFA